MSDHPDFGHAPMTAAASKALAAGGASRKGCPSPFHRALESPELSYHHWWILIALRVRTARTAEKIREAELAKLQAGLKTNSYGDHLSHDYGHFTSERAAQKYAIQVTELHGFEKHRKRFYPRKSTTRLTSHTLDAVCAVLKICHGIEWEENRVRSATRHGFLTPAAHDRWLKRCTEHYNHGDSAGYQRGLQQAKITAQTAAFADLNDYGLSQRDVFHGPRLTLWNFYKTRCHTVSLVDYFAIGGTSFDPPDFRPIKAQWRDRGWNLPEWKEPPPPPRPSRASQLPTTAKGRLIDERRPSLHPAPHA